MNLKTKTAKKTFTYLLLNYKKCLKANELRDSQSENALTL